MSDVVRITSTRTIEVAGRNFPAHFTNQDVNAPTFRIRRARVLFEGGQVLVEWTSRSFSDNADHGPPGTEFNDEPHRVEVGLWWDGGSSSAVLGYVPAAGLRAMLEFIAGGGTVETIVDAWKHHVALAQVGYIPPPTDPGV